MKSTNKDIELYYIQFWFCTNRQMLLKGLRGVYDEAFKTYKSIYKEAEKLGVKDLSLIGKKFEEKLCQRKK